MKREDIIKKLQERQELAQRAFEAYQQLEGQIVLLRELLKEAVEEAKDNKGENINPKEVK